MLIYASCQFRHTELIIWRKVFVSLWWLEQQCWHVTFVGSSIYCPAVLFVFTAISGSLIQQSNYYSRYSYAIIANRVNTNPIDMIIFSILILFSFRWIFNPISFLFFIFLISYENLIFILRLETCYIHNALLFLCMPNHPFALVMLSRSI
jgi:hypothetical protein